MIGGEMEIGIQRINGAAASVDVIGGPTFSPGTVNLSSVEMPAASGRTAS